MRSFLAAHWPHAGPGDERAAAVLGGLTARSAPRAWTRAGVVLAAAPLPARAHEPAWEPVVLADGRLALTGYVRLDDRARLEARVPGPCGDGSDEALFLRAWAAHGEGVLDDVVGAFGVAIWDGESRRLTAVRDHLGLQPLYWTPWQGGHVVASSPGPLLALPGVDATVDPVSVAATRMRRPHVVRGRSLYVGVRSVHPGSVLSLGANAVGRSHYWVPAARPVARPAAEVVAELRDLLPRVVSAAVTDGPVGAHVSGGLDSSAVAGVAQDVLRSSGTSLVAGFSWSPPTEVLPLLGADDERHRLGRFMAALGVPLVYSDFDEVQLAASMRDALTPGGVGGLFHEPAVVAAAAERGVRVLLSGWGGDELTSWNGRGALPGLLHDRRVLTAARASLAAARGRPGVRPPVVRAAWSMAQAAATLRPARWHRRSGASATSWLNGGPAGRSLPEAAREVLRAGPHLAPPWVGAARSQVRSLENGHLTQRIVSWAHGGAEVGVEYRYPLLDRRVVDLVLSIPDELHAQSPGGRWLLRDAAADWVPDDIRLGPAKDEPAKWRRQVGVVAASPPVHPTGDGAAADLFAQWAVGRRERYRLLAEDDS